jgi:hypothetical protein
MSMSLLLALGGCRQDLLLMMGSVTGLEPRVERVVVAPPPVTVRAADTLGEPTEVVVQEGLGAQEAEGEEEAADRPDVPVYNPVSMPEGARESGGVKWNNVKSKGGVPASPYRGGPIPLDGGR